MTPGDTSWRVEQLVRVVEVVVRGLVDDEAAVRVTAIVEQLHTNLRVSVADGDFGKVVGRGGQNVEAMRVLMHAIGGKLGLPGCTLFIEDPNPDWRGRGGQNDRSQGSAWRRR